jgi:signal-transduction protein with cAMP-binding, CBS, and nucleotidyltransferase domain
MIGELSTKPVVTIATTATVQEAARLMKQKNVGAVIVVNGDRPCGILTDRDIAVGVVATGIDAATVEVGKVMHKNPAVIREDKGIFDVVKMFDAKGVRRLPVVDAGGHLSGIVALDDVLMLFGREMGHVASALSRELRRPRAVH